MLLFPEGMNVGAAGAEKPGLPTAQRIVARW